MVHGTEEGALAASVLSGAAGGPRERGVCVCVLVGGVWGGMCVERGRKGKGCGEKESASPAFKKL